MSDTSRPGGPIDDQTGDEYVAPQPVSAFDHTAVDHTATDPAFIEPAVAEDRTDASYAPPTLVEPEPAEVGPADHLPTGEIPAEALPTNSAPIEPAAAQPVAAEPVVAQPAVVAHPVAAEPVAPHPVVADPTVATPVVAATPTGLPPVAPDNRVVYVDAPEPPRRRGNRGFGVLFVIIATIVFAAAYALAAAIILVLSESGEMFGAPFTGFIQSSAFWVPPLFFLVAYLLLVLVVNRGGWWAYIIGSIIVGLIVYFGSIVVFVLQQHITGMTPADAGRLFGSFIINPYLILAGLLARESALWFGAAIASHGRRVKARNIEARETFDREQEEEQARRDATYAPAL